MTQIERREYLIRALLRENEQYKDLAVPDGTAEQRLLLRALFNVRVPAPAPEDFLTVQDAYLQEETRQKEITRLSDLSPVQEDIYLWQGDITALQCDAIVNAANLSLTF